MRVGKGGPKNRLLKLVHRNIKTPAGFSGLSFRPIVAIANCHLTNKFASVVFGERALDKCYGVRRSAIHNQ